MNLSIPLLGACLLAASTALYAQAPQTDAGKGQRFDCSKAKDPKRCEERREKMKAAHSQAEKACAGKQGDAHRDCMRHEMCAQAKDPAKCEARAKANRERREQKK
jgi:hypothetical protein